MATVTAYSAIRMDQASVWSGTVTIFTSTHIQIVNGSNKQDYFGFGFTADASGNLNGGTLTGAEFHSNDVRVWEVTGLSGSAVIVNDFLNRNDTQGLYTYVLGADDRFNGSSGDDFIYGKGGNDTVLSGAGNDTVDGGAGDDYLDGQAGNDSLNGGPGDDTLASSGGFDTLDGGVDIDTADFSSFAAAVWASLSYTGPEVWTRDSTTLSAGAWRTLADLSNVENVTGSNFDDEVLGDGGVNRLDGGAGADKIDGGLGDDILAGGGGNDTLYAGLGTDVLDGGAGTDTADFSQFAAAVWVDLSYTTMEGWSTDASTLPAGTWRTIADLSNVENITGSNYADELRGDGGGNQLDGGVGNDLLDGGNGSDALNGGAGNDTLYAGLGTDIVDGGAGIDTADFSRFGSAVWVDLGYTPMEGWTTDSDTVTSGAWRQMADLSNVENVTGSSYADELHGNASDNVLGYTGGLDLLDGGAGTDTADFSRFGSAVWVDLNYTPMEGWTTDSATVTSGVWRQVADLSNVENVTGSNFADELTGDAGANRLDGGAGNDRLDGGGGDDTVYAGLGLDLVNGGTGNDTSDFSKFGAAVWVDLSYTPMEGWTMDTTQVTSGTWRQMADLSNVENITGSNFADDLRGDGGANRIEGGGGSDALKGGGGSDSFVYKAIADRGATFDVVSDFTKGAGGDVLDLRDVLSTFSGYNGTNAFAGGYLQFTASGADTLVNLDSDGGANSFTTLATLTNVLLTQADSSNYVV